MRWITLFGKCIYTSPSGYKVYENFFYRWLTLDSPVLQTIINKRNAAKPVLYYLPAFTLMVRATPDHCCILGLGGAAVVHTLASSPYSITVVDNSKEVIEIAQRYFMINKISQLNLIHQSAEVYLEQCSIQYRHLLVDLYNAEHFPPECNSDDFFLQCKKCLTADGFLAVNLANYKEQHAILQLIKNHFINTLVVPIKKCANIVIIASNQPQKDHFIDSIMATKKIKKIKLVSSWGYVGEFV